MKRALLETLLREIERVTGEHEIVMIGSQCVHAITQAPPAEVLMSAECDVLVEEGPLSERLDAELGNTSAFQRAHGVYVDTVPPGFPFLPPKFEDRLLELRVGTFRARCLEVHDLAISKLAAGRLKDTETIAALLSSRWLDPETLRDRIAPVEDLRLRAILLARLRIVLESIGR